MPLAGAERSFQYNEYGFVLRTRSGEHGMPLLKVFLSVGKDNWLVALLNAMKHILNDHLVAPSQFALASLASGSWCLTNRQGATICPGREIAEFTESAVKIGKVAKAGLMADFEHSQVTFQQEAAGMADAYLIQKA